VVFGEGNPESPIMFVGEGPGQQEDQTGRPFVGPAGQLLDKILVGVKLDRSKVYITNVVKCRPPGNRDPEPGEFEACCPILESQFARIKPKILVVLGNVPKRALLGETAPGITRCRGFYYPWRPGTVLVPFFHPSYLLRNDSRQKGSPKWHTWKDVQELRRRYDLILEGSTEALEVALRPTAELP
jgi:DNA polymerase